MQEKNNMDFDRNNLLNILSENIQMMNEKLQNGRIKNPENEKIKITQMKAVVYACKVYSEIYKQKQLDEFKRELEIIRYEVKNSQDKENMTKDLKVVESAIKELTDL